MHWLGYCVATHLLGDSGLSCVVLDEYLNSFNDGSGLSRYELSELYMYKAIILEEAGKYEEADRVLENEEKSIVDKVGYLEARARVCFRLKKYSEAEAVLRRLLPKIPENSQYALSLLSCMKEAQGFWPPPHSPGCNKQSFPSNIMRAGFGQGESPFLGPASSIKGGWHMVGRVMRKSKVRTHHTARPLTEDEEQFVIDFFGKLAEEHPSSEGLKFLPVYFVTGKRFTDALDTFLRSRLRKGIPSLFSTIKPLYYVGKCDLIES